MSVQTPAALPESGKTTAGVVYVLYLLSLPSIGLLMFAGVIVAYLARGNSAGWVRTHFDREIAVFWTTLWWSVGFGVAAVVGVVLSLVGVGLIILWAIGIAAAILAIWFHFVSLIGLFHLIQDKHA